MDDIPVGLYRTAPDGCFLEANSALVALLGYPDRAALLAATVPSIYVDPDERTQWTNILSKSRVVRDFEFQLRRLGGEIIWVRDTTRAIHAEDGSLLYYEGALEDITAWVTARQALKRSENYFRALIEKSFDIISVVDVDGTVRYESPSLFSVLRYTPEEMVGQNVFSFVHPDDVEMVSGLFTTMLVDGLPGSRAQCRFRHKDGSWRLMDATATNLLANPDVGGVVINSRDVTEHVALEDKVRQGAKMEAVGRLAGGIAHDFNNLVTAIGLTAELLSDDLAGNDNAVAELQEIRLAADRAASLTRQLLAFSRRQVLQPTVLNLNDVITRIQGMLERLIGVDIQIVTALAPGLDDIRVDATQIEQVILNLAINARDAMRGIGKLKLETKNIELSANDRPPHVDALPGPYVQLDVCDTGTGIEPEILPHIFEPFFTTKPTGAGTGLGLATVFGIVQQSGGYVFATNRTTGGTSFCILFPRAEGIDAQGEDIPARSEPGLGTETVLLVEDEAVIRRVTKRMLERAGFHVIDAEDGPSALELVSDNRVRIDLLLSDVVMPRMRGPELAGRLLEANPTLGVLYMSGFHQEAVEGNGIFGPGISFIHKPFEIHQLILKVREVLDRKR